MSQIPSTTYMVLDGGGGHTTAGSTVAPVQSSNRANRIAQSQGKYSDAVMRGRVWTGCTAVGGVAPGTSVATTAAFTLANPTGSGVNAVVLRASLGLVTGVLGAGSIVFVANQNPAAAAVSGTAITPYNNFIGGGYAASSCAPFTTATLPATGLLLRPAWSLSKITIATTALRTEQNIIDVDGEFIITPGCSLSLMGVAVAGTSPLVILGMTWEEVGIN